MNLFSIKSNYRCIHIPFLSFISLYDTSFVAVHISKALWGKIALLVRKATTPYFIKIKNQNKSSKTEQKTILHNLTHTVRVLQKYLQAQGVLRQMVWAPQSPDLNVAESVCDYMKRQKTLRQSKPTKQPS